MSRILDALKKGPATPKPLIFEKVSFDLPASDAKRPVVRPPESDQTRHFVTAFIALLIAGLAAVWLWPGSETVPDESLKESARMRETIIGLETQLVDKQAEIERLSVLPASIPEDDDTSQLESLRGEVRQLNRRLAVMLQDNLEKDQEISRLQSS